MSKLMAGGHDLKGQIVQLRVPPAPRIWGPGITDDLGLALDARNEMTLHKSARGDLCACEGCGG